MTEDIVTIRRESVEQLRLHLEDIRELHGKGLIPKVDVLRAGMALDEARQDAAEAGYEILSRRPTASFRLGYRMAQGGMERSSASGRSSGRVAR